MKLQLFSQEVTELVQSLEPQKKEPKVRKTRATKKREPTRTDLRFEISQSRKRLEELEAQDETGWSEFDISVKGKKVNSMLVRNHITYYQKQLAELRAPYTEVLNKWKKFIVGLVAEQGQEADIIWFDESAPYECEVCVRMKGHRCWNSCVDFRFEKGQLRAFDSGFGGGTTMLEFGCRTIRTDEETGEIIKGVMERVFKKDCDEAHVKFWDKGDYDKPISHREITIDETGWANE